MNVQRGERPSVWWTVVATIAIVLVAPWLVAITWGKGRPDTVVALGLFLATPIIIVVGVVLGFGIYGLRFIPAV